MGEITDVFQKMFIAGLEGVSVSMEKAKEVTDELVKKGKSMEEEDGSGGLVDEAMKRGAEFGKEVEKKISEVAKESFGKMNLASNSELTDLKDEIAELKKKIETMENGEKQESGETEEKAS